MENLPHVIDTTHFTPHQWQLYDFRLRAFTNHLPFINTSTTETNIYNGQPNYVPPVPTGPVDLTMLTAAAAEATRQYNNAATYATSAGYLVHFNIIMELYRREFQQIQHMHFVDVGSIHGKIQECQRSGSTQYFYIGYTEQITGNLWNTGPKATEPTSEWQQFRASVSGNPVKSETYYTYYGGHPDPNNKSSLVRLYYKPGAWQATHCLNGTSETAESGVPGYVFLKLYLGPPTM